MSRIDSEIDQRSYAVGLMLRRLSPEQIGLVRKAQLGKKRAPSFTAIDAAIDMHDKIRVAKKPETEPHLTVDDLGKPKDVELPKGEGVATASPTPRPIVDPRARLRKMLESEQCPHW